ncbi:hypothetical protein [Actinomadura kijaniata]|uniref:hypothetical protein n=1 Tax=Actinomadura kijaniata TaxID=46161 RepID=UPI00082BBBDA|nr:hypothetical protein [Actinomadura kijaniata]
MFLNSVLTGARPVDRSPDPDGLELAEDAYRYARRQAAITDTAALTRALAELNITPIPTDDPDDFSETDQEDGLVGPPMHIEADGTVTTLIAAPSWVIDDDGQAVARGRYVWACARQGWLWLRASDATGQGLGDAGPLETLADVGRALVQGPTHPLCTPRPDGPAAPCLHLLAEEALPFWAAEVVQPVSPTGW